jgi:hypothetical protein
MRGLLMLECLYHQTVKGVKTMTRRSSGLEAVNENPDGWVKTAVALKNDYDSITYGGQYFKPVISNVANGLITETCCKPRYKVGEVLYLKEPTREINGRGDIDQTQYAYSTNSLERSMGAKWQNKLFMPATAARAFIQIAGIKCERLLDISHRDAILEGIEMDNKGLYKDYVWDKGFLTARDSFINIYQKANKHTRLTPLINIWVWAYTYEFLKDYNHGS